MRLISFLSVLMLAVVLTGARGARAKTLLQGDFHDAAALPGTDASPFKKIRYQKGVKPAEDSPKVADGHLIVSVDNQSNGNSGATLQSKKVFDFTKQAISLELTVGELKDTGEAKHGAAATWAFCAEPRAINPGLNRDEIFIYYSASANKLFVGVNVDGKGRHLSRPIHVAGGKLRVRLDLDADDYTLFVNGIKKASGRHHLNTAEFAASGGGTLMLYQRSSTRMVYDAVKIVSPPEEAPSPAAAQADMKYHVAKPDAQRVKPVVGLVYSASDIEQARVLARTQGAYAGLARQILSEAAFWMAMPQDKLDALFPGPDAVYAYGMAGDPKTGQRWPHFGDHGICSLDRPGTVKSLHTGDIYGNAKPGEPYYDPGDGWVRPSDGKRFYFKGVWNAFVIRKLHEAIDRLSMGYMLTGDEGMARRALLIFDHLATLRPQCNPNGAVDNIRDWMHNYGFFSYMGNLANDRMVHSATDFDLLGESRAAAEPSPTRPGVTIAENIEQHYFHVFEREGHSRTVDNLQNHAVAMVSNVLAQALLFGRPKDLQFGIDFIGAALANAVDRDGDWYEIGGQYGGRVGSACLRTAIILLRHYDPAHYAHDAHSQAFPSAKGLNFADDPRWFNLAVRPLYHMAILGRFPNNGDSPVDQGVILEDFLARYYPWQLTLLGERRSGYLSLTYHLATDPAVKARCAALYERLPAKYREASPEVDQYGAFWPQPSPPTKDADDALTPLEASQHQSILLGGKGIAILRDGKGADQRALFMRGGVNASHAHDDQMSVLLYARGMELNGEFGYGYYGRPDHVGFGCRAIAHNLVVVNQDEHLQQALGKRIQFKECPGARTLAFVPKGTAKLTEMSNPRQWRQEGVTQYRRGVWMVRVSDRDCYWLDVFRVRGGRTHDYVWRARYVDPAPSDVFSVQGVSPESSDGAWTLAGLDPRWRDATFDAPGRSWGERRQADGGVKDLHLPGEQLGFFGWNPPPGNGYGWLWDVKSAPTDKAWSAIWKLGDAAGNRMKATMLNADGETAITVLAPTRQIGTVQHEVIARREAEGDQLLRSRFVNLVQVSPSAWPVAACELTPVETTGEVKDVVAVTARLADGRRDLIVSTTDPDTSVTVADSQATLRGEHGFVRWAADGKVSDMMLEDGTLLEAGPVSLKLAQPRWTATVTAVEASPSENRVTVDRPLPSLKQAGRIVLFDRPDDAKIPYGRNAAYPIHRVEKAGHSDAYEINLGFEQLHAAVNTVESVDAKGGLIHVRWPMTLGYGEASDEFNGRRVTVRDDPSRFSTVLSLPDSTTLRVADPQRFKAGEMIAVAVVQPGDIAVMRGMARLTRTGPGAWRVASRQAVTLTLPSGGCREAVVTDVDGRSRTVAIRAEASTVRIELAAEETGVGAAVVALR